MAIKLECDLCGKLVTEDKRREDGSIEEWEAHAEQVRPFVAGDCATICSECFEPIRLTVYTVVGALRRLKPPNAEPDEYPSRAAVAALG